MLQTHEDTESSNRSQQAYPAKLDSCTPTQPLTLLVGVKHRRRDAPTPQPADALASPKRQRRPPGHAPCASTLTTVPPPSGPLHGCTSSTRTDTSRRRTPLDVYSRALLLTSMRASPAAARVELHTSALELAHTARRTTLPKRHVSEPSASDADEKPLPCTVTGVPPS